MADLTDHMPIPHNDPSGFVEAGYHFKAWQLANDGAPESAGPPSVARGG